MSGAGEELGTLKGLGECALTLREVFGARCPDDLSAFMEYLLDETRVLDLLAGLGAGQAYLKEEALQVHTLLRWADAGMPAFDLTHGLMAALLLTDPAGVGAEAVKLPFSTFAVRLPDGFWTLQGHEGETTGASVVLVHTYRAITSRSPESRPLFSFRICGRNGRTNTWEVREPLPEEGEIGAWIADDVPEVEDPSGAVIPPDEQDKRLAVACRRLIVNLCLYVAAHGRGTQLGGRRKPGRGSRPLRDPQPAAPDIWVLGREVKLHPELIASAKAWTDAKRGRPGAAEGWRLRSRFTVRGHWRHQAHGPGLSLRRLTWIAPYWKGEGPSFAHVYRGPEGEGDR